MGWLIALGVIAAIGQIISTVGQVGQTLATAQAEQLKAHQLKEQADLQAELAKEGGYYDQQIAAIKLDLANIEEEKAAAGELAGISILGISRQGAQATGAIAARAGVGNLAQTGSVAIQKGAVKEQVGQQVEQVRVQYESQIRSLALRKAQDVAQQTLAQWNKEKTQLDVEQMTEQAGQLTSEAEWLSTWGVGLTVAGGIINTVSGFFSPFNQAGVNPFSKNVVQSTSTSQDFGTLYGETPPPTASSPYGGTANWRSY